MKKIIRKKTESEKRGETRFVKIKCADFKWKNELFYCEKHEVVFEPSDEVFRGTNKDKDWLFCPLKNKNILSLKPCLNELTTGTKQYFEENYIYEDKN